MTRFRRAGSGAIPVQSVLGAARGRRRRAGLGEQRSGRRGAGPGRCAQGAGRALDRRARSSGSGSSTLGDHAFVARAAARRRRRARLGVPRDHCGARRRCSSAPPTTARDGVDDRDGRRARARSRRRSPRRASSRGRRRGRRPGATSARCGGCCQGSGKTPYQVQVDITGPAYTCSCPSRKVPCKHALALLLLAAGGEVREGEPAGVGRRSARSARRDRGRRASRRATRRRRRAARPSVRSASRPASRTCGCGCATRSAAGSAPAGCGRGTSGTRSRRGWSTRRRRARRRGCGRWAASPRAGPDGWPERLLSGMGLLHLLCEAHGRADGPLRDDVRTLLGWNVAARGRAGRPRVRDRWTVLARVGARAGAPARAAHVAVGADSERPALLLDFAPPGAPLAPRPPAGRRGRRRRSPSIPGATPLRALVAGETSALDDGAGRVRRRRRRGRAGDRRPRRSPRTRGSTSGRSRSPPRCPTARDRGR